MHTKFVKYDGDKHIQHPTFMCDPAFAFQENKLNLTSTGAGQQLNSHYSNINKYQYFVY